MYMLWQSSSPLRQESLNRWQKNPDLKRISRCFSFAAPALLYSFKYSGR